MRRLGHDNEDFVDVRSGRLTYSLYVDAGHFGRDFTFDIGQGDLDVMLVDPYRRAVLFVVAHAVLQDSIIPGGKPVSQAAFEDIVRRVLHSEANALEDYVGRVDGERNISVKYFVEQVIAQQSPGRGR